MMTAQWGNVWLGAMVVSVVAAWLPAGAVAEELPGADRVQARRRFEQVSAKAVNFLLTKGQADDGSFSRFAGPGVTAIAITGLLRHGVSPDDPRLSKSLKYLESFIQDDGGIYQEGSYHRNYETSVSVVCFADANRDGRYAKVLKNADAFLKGLQREEGGSDISEATYGGAGYGKSKRPDLSNTSFFLEALKATGNDANSEAVQRALVFISRCQNLESAHNTTPFPAKNPDGGFYYSPASGGVSQAGQTEAGGLRSYGSMTYAGLKSMIFAGVSPDDPRVKAALKWIARHYDLASNPGMGDAGLFYYYHTFAKALDAVGERTFRDEAGQTHDWRAELVQVLAEKQRADGSWVNGNARWLEGDANLVTAYGLLTLAYCKPQN